MAGAGADKVGIVYLGQRMNIGDGLGLLVGHFALTCGAGVGGRQGADALGHRPVAAPEDPYGVGRHRLGAVLVVIELQVLLLEPARPTIRQLVLAPETSEYPAQAHVPYSGDLNWLV